jgi:Flp pilus assembly protein TadG
MSVAELSRSDKGAVSVMFAAAAVPIVGLLGLAIDVSFLTQAKSSLTLAADTAALDAVKLASNEVIAGTTSTQAQNDGQCAGEQWFIAQLGSVHGATPVSEQLTACANTPGANSNVSLWTSATSNTVVTVNGSAFSAQVSYNATVPAYFTAMFGIRNFPVAGVSNAAINIDAYVNIYMLIDNSGSMLIGSTSADINELQSLSACSPESGTSAQGTSAYTGTYTPSICPSPVNSWDFTATSGVSYSPGLPTANKAPIAAECGFACHWSANSVTKKVTVGTTLKTVNDLSQYDYYYLARNPTTSAAYTAEGYTAAPVLRFDVVQQAAASVVSAMTSNEVLTNQFGLGVYEFNESFTRVYPTGTAEASTDLAAGLTAINAITTPQISNNGDTDFPDAMTALIATPGSASAGGVTAAGTGGTSTSPQKVLFIVTDGIQDYGSRSLGTTEGPMGCYAGQTTTCSSAATTACSNVKALGIKIYVLYTPYNRLIYNPYYMSNIDQYVDTPPTPNYLTQALENCASEPTDFYEADNASQIVTGLTALLQAAIKQPAHITS